MWSDNNEGWNVKDIFRRKNHETKYLETKSKLYGHVKGNGLGTRTRESVWKQTEKPANRKPEKPGKSVMDDAVLFQGAAGCEALCGERIETFRLILVYVSAVWLSGWYADCCA